MLFKFRCNTDKMDIIVVGKGNVKLLWSIYRTLSDLNEEGSHSTLNFVQVKR